MSGCGDGDAVEVSKEMERTAQQVLGGSHPYTVHIEGGLRASRGVLSLSAGEGDVESVREAVEAMTPGDA